MSAREAIQSRRNALFAFHLAAWMRERSLEPKHILLTVYGLKDGRVAGSGKLYNVFRGSAGLTAKTLERWSEKLEIPRTEMEAWYGRDVPAGELASFVPVPPRRGRPKKAVLPGAPPPPAIKPPPAAPPAPVKADPPPFSLVVGPDGLAALQVNLVGLPVDKVAGLLTALQDAGVFPPRGS